MYKKILIPIDGSKQSYKALDAACELAKKLDSTIYILSIFRHHSFLEGSLSMVRGAIDPENLEDVLGGYAREIVENGKKIAVNSGLSKEKVKGFIRGGQIAKQILNFQKTNDIDLIVIGKQGDGDLSGYLLGGVSHKVSGLARCPVLIM